MQLSTAEETIQRLIFSLSELEHLGQTLISGRSNFNISSKTYLRITLGTLQVTGGAILCYQSTDDFLNITASTPEVDVPPIEIEPDEITSLLACAFVDLDNPPDDLQAFIDRNAESLNCNSIHQLWVPLKIQEEFLGYSEFR